MAVNNRNKKSSPSVSIIVLNWNGVDDTIDCLNSLSDLAFPNFDVIVVDNGSTDNSLVYLRSYPSKYPLKIIENGVNLGFAEGNNVGIRAAMDDGADYVLLLNNDTVVDCNLVREFVEAATKYPEAGVFSAKIYYHAEQDKIWYAGAKWDDVAQHFSHIGIGQIDDGISYDDVQETDYASGCALFISTDVINRIGLMDPKYYLTYEETDWCYRIRSEGLKCLYIPRAKLWHKVSSSFGGVESPLQLYFYSRNILLWAERYLSRDAYWSLVRKTFGDVLRFSTNSGNDIAAVKRWFWEFISLWKRLRRGGSDAASRARYLGFRDYVFRRFGDCPQEVRQLRVGR